MRDHGVREFPDNRLLYRSSWNYAPSQGCTCLECIRPCHGNAGQRNGALAQERKDRHVTEFGHDFKFGPMAKKRGIVETEFPCQCLWPGLGAAFDIDREFRVTGARARYEHEPLPQIVITGWAGRVRELHDHATKGAGDDPARRLTTPRCSAVVCGYRRSTRPGSSRS
jgi:hypothetical protein